MGDVSLSEARSLSHASTTRLNKGFILAFQAELERYPRAGLTSVFSEPYRLKLRNPQYLQLPYPAKSVAEPCTSSMIHTKTNHRSVFFSGSYLFVGKSTILFYIGMHSVLNFPSLAECASRQDWLAISEVRNVGIAKARV